MKITDEALDRCFAELERAAVAGERCPMNGCGTDVVQSSLVNALAHDGRIRSEVGGKNWRTVTILVGPNAGKSTMQSPYFVRGRARTYGPQPSAPRSFA